MKKRLLVSTLPALATVALAAPAAASAQTNSAVSENWAGYVDSSSSGQSFSSASGSWTEPSLKCTSGQATYSAYWVGIGGGSSSSDALEQEGTQADCSASGQATHYAWYELVPSAPVKINMAVSPGDKMYARTQVSGNRVTVEVDNQTTGQSFKKTLTMSTTPDTSTAEWIAEAPSECQSASLSNCQVLSLANFGSVKFTDAQATAGGHTGSISDSKFSTTAVGLSNASGFTGGGYGGYGYSGGAGSSATSGYGSTGYGASGYGSSGYGSDGWGDSGYGMGMGGYGFTRLTHSPVVANTSLVSSSGSAAPSSLSNGGADFTVYYGKALSGATSTSLTGSGSGSQSATGSSTSGYGASGYGSGGYGYGSSGYGSDGQGSSDYGWGDSGYGDDNGGSSTGSTGSSGLGISQNSSTGTITISLGDGYSITI